jgi:lysine 6-dehydrogenase
MAEERVFNYLIIGAGRQGTAAAYDLALYGSPAKIILADINLEAAENAARRIAQLTSFERVKGTQLDVTDRQDIRGAMEGMDAVLSAVPYKYNLLITEEAVQQKINVCDMGGSTDIVRRQLKLDSSAAEAGVSIVPDCGMGPGLINTMGAYVIDLLDEPEEVYIYDAGLPINPVPPWNYQLTFHINGLTNEMDGWAVFLRNGEVVQVETLSEPEFIEFPPLGLLEADVTSGGTSTAPWTFKDRLKRYENKVLRYQGHYEWLRAYKQLGLFSETPVRVGEQTVIPRELYHTLLEPQITAETIHDICVIRARGVGKKNGHPAAVEVDLVDRYDERTGFTAMERLTGWHCSIIMIFQAAGMILPGASPLETAIAPELVMEAFARRGIQHEIRWLQKQEKQAPS